MVYAALMDTGSEAILGFLASIDRRLAQIVDAVTNSPPSPIQCDQAYSRQQAAKLLGVSVWLVDKARKEGLLREAERIGQRTVRCTGESLLRFAAERHSKSGTTVLRM